MRNPPDVDLPPAELASHPNYLGNPELVSALIRGWLDSCLARRNGKSGPAFALKESEEAKALARIFLGMDPDFIPRRGFNQPWGIDSFLRDHAGETIKDPVLAVANVLLGALLRLLKILSEHDGDDPTNWGYKVEGLCMAYEQLFLGISSSNDDL